MSSMGRERKARKAELLDHVMGVMPEVRAALARAVDMADLLDKIEMIEACYADLTEPASRVLPPRSKLAREGLAPEVRKQVEVLAAGENQVFAQRASLILALADGASVSRIAEDNNLKLATVEGIRRRFERDGVPSLLRPRGRSPKPKAK